MFQLHLNSFSYWWVVMQSQWLFFWFTPTHMHNTSISMYLSCGLTLLKWVCRCPGYTSFIGSDFSLRDYSRHVFQSCGSCSVAGKGDIIIYYMCHYLLSYLLIKIILLCFDISWTTMASKSLQISLWTTTWSHLSLGMTFPLLFLSIWCSRPPLGLEETCLGWY